MRGTSLQVLYEDNHLIAVNKPAGVLVHGDETGDIPLTEYVKEYIKVRYDKPGDVFLGVIHRIDRPVSGAIIFARTSKGLERMNKVFRDRAIEKEYWAITSERPDELNDKLTHYLLKDRSRNVTKAYDRLGRRTADAKLAELDYELIGSLDKHHLLKVNLKTGRPHQIRVQLSAIGCPIRGDRKYGSNMIIEDGSILLHCHALRFEHPIKKEPIEIIAETPEHVAWRQFDFLQK